MGPDMDVTLLRNLITLDTLKYLSPKLHCLFLKKCFISNQVVWLY